MLRSDCFYRRLRCRSPGGWQFVELRSLHVSFVRIACSARAQSAPAKPQIGFLVDSFKIERWQTDYNSFEKRAKELGAEVVVEDAGGNDDTQFRQAKKLIEAHVKALVLVPHNTDKAVRIVELAKSKGVPVISYDRLIRNSDIDFYVGADTVAIGFLQATALTAPSVKRELHSP